MIPYGRQDISEEDIAKVEAVLRSDFLTQGPITPKFEDAVAGYCGADHAIAVNSATSALHLACLALDLGPGDWLWTSANTFVASANCGLYCGANVDFVDIDQRTYNMSLDDLSDKLAKAEQERRLPKVVIPVHFAGQSCDMAAIKALANRYAFKIIEDASHAIGASYKNVKVGSCEYSDVTVFSFHPVKIITSAEGGMALTNNKEIADRIRQLRTHGITNDSSIFEHTPEDEIWNYQQQRLGFNYRMTDVHAALGLSQLGRLDEFVKRRHSIAERYDRELDELPLITPWQHPDNYSAWHLYPVLLDLTKTNATQRFVYQSLQEQGILANLHYIPVYRQPYFAEMGFRKNYCPNAEAYFKSAISIPMFATLTEGQQGEVIQALGKSFERSG
jgi:UDP-4-amino-4,6-dideoxy-N-acetyl-beta-L-altrosamine transaminase